MLLLVNCFIVMATAILVLAFIQNITRSSYLLALVVTVSAELVIIFQGLSLLTALTSSAVMLSQIVIFFITAITWSVTGRPTLLAPFRLPDGRLVLWPTRDMLKSGPLLVIVAIAVTMGLFILLAICLLSYDEFIDTVLYHYPKIALWKQNRTMFFNWETSRFIRDSRIIGSPPVAEILYLWLFFWLGSIKAINVIDLLAVFPAMLAIYGIVVQLGRSRNAAWLSALIFPSFELVIWNLVHANAVMVLTAFLLAGIHFLKQAEKEGNHHAILLSATSLALAVATKPSVYTLLPFLGILLVLSLIRGTRLHGYRWLRRWIAAGVIALLVVAAPIWIQNLVLFHDPLLISHWGVAEISRNTDPAECAGMNILRNIHARSAPHIALPVIGDALVEPFTEAVLLLGRTLQFDLLSDSCRASSSFTPTAFKPAYSIIYIPLFIMATAATWWINRKWKHRNTLPFWFLLLGFFVLFSSVRPYSETSYRYFAVSAAFFSIILSDLFDLISRRKGLIAVIFGISLLSGGAYLRMQVLESFKSPAGFLSAIGGTDMREPADITLQGILEPGTRSLGVFRSYDAIDIAYFGDDLSRTIYFSDCVSIYRMLTAAEHDYLIYDSTYPDWDFEACLAEYQTPEGNPLRELLANEYTRIYERWNQYRYLLIFRQNESAPLYAAFPPDLPVIIIAGEYQQVIGGGPVAFFQRGTGLDGEEFMFSLRSLADIQAMPVSISFNGQPCAADQLVIIRVYDENYVLLYEDSLPLFSGSLRFTTSLRTGINRVVVDEVCEADSTNPLQINEVLVGE